MAFAEGQQREEKVYLYHLLEAATSRPINPQRRADEEAAIDHLIDGCGHSTAELKTFLEWLCHKFKVKRVGVQISWQLADGRDWDEWVNQGRPASYTPPGPETFVVDYTTRY